MKKTASIQFLILRLMVPKMRYMVLSLKSLCPRDEMLHNFVKQVTCVFY